MKVVRLLVLGIDLFMGGCKDLPGEDVLGALAGRAYATLPVAQAGVEGRGLIGWNFPDEPEGYIHRIGRTARMGREGHAISLVTPEERVSLGRIERTLGITLEREMVEGFEQPEITASKPVKLFSSGFSARASRNRTRMKWA